MNDPNELVGDELPTTAIEERLGRFLDEAMNAARDGSPVDVAALLADQPDLIARGRRLIRDLECLRRATATTTFETPLPDPFPGDFRIRGLLGQGTFGKVWLADDLHLSRRVALKTLHLPADVDPSGLENLRKEAGILAGLDHPNIVKVHTWRQAGGEHYLVLEYVAGGSLADLLKEEGPMSWQRAARYVANVAEGLIAVHDKGIIHRDIKASNMLWEPARDEAKLTDFGVAGRLGVARTAVGTLAFMAPEALHGRATAASDVYSLTATLFHLTTGELPFPAATMKELAVGDERFRLVPQRVEGIIRAGLAADQADRPSLTHFINLLWGALNQTLVDDFLPRSTEGTAASLVKLRLEISRKPGGAPRRTGAGASGGKGARVCRME